MRSVPRRWFPVFDIELSCSTALTRSQQRNKLNVVLCALRVMVTQIVMLLRYVMAEVR